MQAFGVFLARNCPAGLQLHLQGDLGAGKTTLVRGFLRGMGYEGRVKSPTYTLVEPYPVDSLTVYHLDLYRLADPEELEYIGMRDMLTGESICLVEWPEKGEGWLPAPDMIVSIAYMPDGTGGRNLEVIGKSARGDEVIRCLAKIQDIQE